MNARGGEPYLHIEGLNKSFGDFQALKDISLDVYEGEFVCFLGPSGCGKTTLLRAIAGLDVQTSGRIVQNGRNISPLPVTERDFGIVFQSYALFPNLTVEENVGYGLKGRKNNGHTIGGRVAELLALVGLGDQGRKYPAQLSGGQQQRVALARALAMSPGLLLLDEPLSALDARVRVRLRHEITSLQKRLGVTTIMVTHDQEEALTMADRIVVMNHGVIEQVGTPVEIYREPASVFVADFIGAMSLLPGSAVGNGQVKLGALTVTATVPPDLASGANVWICIRPEDVMVRGIADNTPNRVAVKIDTLEFLGSFYRAALHSEAAPGVAITADFSINAMRDLRLEAGQPLTVALPPERVRVFSRPAGA
ncbi:MAG: putative 2-aminoethylphosphonate ABC transporter ATP-binding protein [Rhodospirillaceae bacterium]|nr:putative 2-aminoethylphosphonate ABC transporter ATP-binding protein [Rhodospirillaceae bacterium]